MRKSVRICLLLLCALALASRVTGMHVHVSLGDEAPLGMHFADVGTDYSFHHDHQSGHGHDQDHDADAHPHSSMETLDGQALSKKTGADRDAGSWLIVATLLFFLQAPREIYLSRRKSPGFKLKRTPYLLPPLRGPPLSA